MTAFTKTQENYIEHEVQLRLHDKKFDSIERAIEKLDYKIDAGLKHLDNKLTWGVGIFITISIVGYMIPVALHFMKLS
jgi:hypothetical protein